MQCVVRSLALLVALAILDATGVSAAAPNLELRVPSTVFVGDTIAVDIVLTGERYFAVADLAFLAPDPALLEFSGWVIPTSQSDFGGQAVRTVAAPFGGGAAPHPNGVLLATFELKALAAGTVNVELDAARVKLFTALTSGDQGTEVSPSDLILLPAAITITTASERTIPTPWAFLFFGALLVGALAVRRIRST